MDWRDIAIIILIIVVIILLVEALNFIDIIPNLGDAYP